MSVARDLFAAASVKMKLALVTWSVMTAASLSVVVHTQAAHIVARAKSATGQPVQGSVARARTSVQQSPTRPAKQGGDPASAAPSTSPALPLPAISAHSGEVAPSAGNDSVGVLPSLPAGLGVDLQGDVTAQIGDVVTGATDAVSDTTEAVSGATEAVTGVTTNASASAGLSPLDAAAPRASGALRGNGRPQLPPGLAK